LRNVTQSTSHFWNTNSSRYCRWSRFEMKWNGGISILRHFKLKGKPPLAVRSKSNEFSRFFVITNDGLIVNRIIQLEAWIYVCIDAMAEKKFGRRIQLVYAVLAFYSDIALINQLNIPYSNISLGWEIVKRWSTKISAIHIRSI
jgi:hypothetical protein